MHECVFNNMMFFQYNSCSELQQKFHSLYIIVRHFYKSKMYLPRRSIQHTYQFCCDMMNTPRYPDIPGYHRITPVLVAINLQTIMGGSRRSVSTHNFSISVVKRSVFFTFSYRHVCTCMYNIIYIHTHTHIYI